MYRKKKSHWCHQTVLVRGPIDYQSNHFDFGLNTHRSKGEPHSTAVNSKSSFTKVNYDNRHNVVSVDEPTFFYTGSKVFWSSRVLKYSCPEAITQIGRSLTKFWQIEVAKKTNFKISDLHQKLFLSLKAALCRQTDI